jgi:geranylgeranyl reductase family protein
VDTCDVLVVGGGPAGSSAASRLVQRGLDVVVLDRRPFPRDKPCAGWITPAVAEALQLDVRDYGRRHVLQRIHGFRVGTIGGRAVETHPAAEPLSYGIRRCEFDDHLLRRSGARLHLGEPLERLERDGRAWIVNGALRAGIVIGAGGHFCPVARRLGARLGRGEPAVVAQEVEFELSPVQREACTVSPRTPEVYFCRDLAGYGWAFRKGSFLNVGLGREKPERLSEHVAAFLRLLVERGKLPADAPLGGLRGHAYLLYPRSSRPLCADGVLLAGDAAGLAYPESGEGIRTAVESGLMAAEVIAGAGGDARAETLAAYAASIARRFGPRSPGPGLAGLLPSRLKRELGERLLGAEWFARRVVVGRWFLHAHVPRLSLIAGAAGAARAP